MSTQSRKKSRNVVEWFAQNGPATAKEYAREFANVRNEQACKSEIHTAWTRHQLSRVVTIEKQKPVWFYYTNEEQLYLPSSKEIYVPLRRLDEMKRAVVIHAIQQLISHKGRRGTIDMVAKIAGYSTHEIENEVYAVAPSLKFQIYKE